KAEKYIIKLLQLSIYSVLFIVPLAFWLPAHESFETPKSVCFYVFIFLALSLYILLQAVRGRFIIKYTSFSLPVLGLILIFFLSLLKGAYINPDAFSLHWQFFKLLLANVILYFLIINVFYKDDIKKILYFIFVSHAIVVIYGLFQLMGVDFIKWVSFGEHRVYSTMGNPDYMSAQFTLIIPLIIMMLLSPFSKIPKFLTALLGVGMAFLIITAQGRGAWLGFIGSVFYMLALLGFVYGKNFFYKYKYFLTGGAVLIIVFAIIFSGPIKKRIKHGLNITSDSVAVRLFYWESALQMAVHNPFLGAGIGGFSLNTAYYQREVLDRWQEKMPAMADKVRPHVELYTHNDFLQTLSETGFLGLGVFLWLIASVFIMNFQKGRAEKDTFIKNLFLGITGVIVAYIINALLNFPWRVTFTLILLWTIFGIYSVTEPKKRINVKFAPDKKLTAVILAAALFLFTIPELFSFRANLLVKSGQDAFSAKQYEKARGMFTTALSSNPRGTDTIELLLYAGNAYHALNDIEQATGYYNRGLAMFPHFIEAH
ncbi:MAG TPA: O-antigen ligase family protein, partial [Spirochaetota bacterium]|nr:O-antigen ligase family protein [Spirochaetota bacterium]